MNKKIASSIKKHKNNILKEFTCISDQLEKHNIRQTLVFFGSARIVNPDLAKHNFQLAQQTGNQSAILEAQQQMKMSDYYSKAEALAYKLGLWIVENTYNLTICSGGGLGIMEAANKGASKANSQTMGLNIELPFEQEANPFLSKDLTFNFKYFFLRKFWFSYLAKAIIVFPGGFGTLDEIFENMTLIQTQKMKPIPIILFDSKFFNELINMDLLSKNFLINPEDHNLYIITDSIDEAFHHIIKNINIANES